MNTDPFLAILGELLAKSVLILAAAAVIHCACRRSSAAQRHLVWCMALGALLLLPLARLHEPRWSVPLQRLHMELAQPQRKNSAPVESSVAAATLAIPIAPAPVGQWTDWPHALIFIWAVVAGLLFAARLLASARLTLLRRGLHTVADARAQRLAAECFRDLKIRRAIDLRSAPSGSVPLTWGTLRPVLALPAEALGWSDARLTAALRHEAGHIARRDHFTRSLAHLACIFYWPNPLVWHAARQLRAAQEEATDDLVLRAGIAPADYAAQLFDVARSLAARRGLGASAVAMASASTLERRMLAIVDPERDRRPLTIGAITGGALAVALTLGLATAAQVQAQQEAVSRAGGVEKVKATPAGDASRSKGPPVEIASRFIEISGDPAGLPNYFKEPDPKTKDALRAILSDADATAALRTLNKTKGVDVLSAPRVTTFSKQTAKIEIVRGFRYATAWEKDASTGAWKGKTFETKNVGVTFEVTPEVKPDGTIGLHLVPEVTELEGFQDLDAKSSGAKPLENRGAAGPDGQESSQRVRTKPVFSTRRIDIRVTAKSGDTIVLGGPGRVDVQTIEDKVPLLGDIPLVGGLFKSTVKQKIKRRLTVLVTARTIDAGGVR